MKKLFLTASVAGVLLFNSCSTVPLTGRSRFDLVSNDQVLPMAFQAYSTFLTENKSTVLPASNAQALKVKTVGSRFCLLYTSPSPRDRTRSRMPSSA